MKVVQLARTTRTFVIDQGTITEVPFEIHSLEHFYQRGWLVRPESYAERKERELRESFEAMGIGQIEEHLQLISRFSHEFQVGASILEQKIADYDREQREDAAEANAHVNDNPVPPAPVSAGSNVSILPVARNLAGLK